MEEDNSINDSDFNSYIQNNIKILADGIKASNTLPVGSARNNFVACFPDYPSEIEPYSTKLLKTISIFLKKENVKSDIEYCDTDEKIDLAVDAVNKILDRVKNNLNELNGIKIIEPSAKSSWNHITLNTKAKTTNQPVGSSKVIEKPQNKFLPKIDNSDTPFKPYLKSKPNAIKPLAVYLEVDTNNVEKYCHPYRHELNCFDVPLHQLQYTQVKLPCDISDNNMIFIDTEEKLKNMLNDLRNEKELAVDLEHHSYRSYQGFTCLMQISSRKMDYIIDTLSLRSNLYCLNELFTDPLIVKVLHGSVLDVVWLQKDLNLYLVNLFDTYLASVALNFPRLSLAYLLKKYCSIESDKRYQLFDWRIRPLSDAAVAYARCDTHYLLYIYDHLRNELLEKGNGRSNMLESVYFQGVELCKKKYEKENTENGHLTLYKNSKQTFDNRQMYALEKLFKWRDEIARREDESTNYVLPNHMLLHISEMLPREMQGILACCNPIPVLVRKNLVELHQIIHKARNQPTSKTNYNIENSSTILNKIPVLCKLRCPHDFSYHDDFRDNLPTLLAGTDTIEINENETDSVMSVFNDTTTASMHKLFEDKINFISPFERYKRTTVFQAAEIEKENQKQEEKEKHQEINKIT